MREQGVRGIQRTLQPHPPQRTPPQQDLCDLRIPRFTLIGFNDLTFYRIKRSEPSELLELTTEDTEDADAETESTE